MGLYIDMEMPQNCQSCNFYNGLGCEATGRMFSLLYNVATRRSDCPLIEVSEPHGRLIDADAVFDNLERTWWYDNADREIAEDLVLDAPTVIPASEEAK